MARLRVTFGRGEAVKYLAHLDLVRMWERIVRRAGLPLSYTEGFTPHPKLSLAAPLPVGVTSEAELLDITFTEPVTPAAFRQAVEPQMPGGVTVVGVAAIADRGLALPALLRAVEYRIVLRTDDPEEQIADRVAGLLAATSLPRVREREGKRKEYDLRPFVEKVWVCGTADDPARIGARLSAGNNGIGRPDELVAALGYPDRPRSIHRTRVEIADD